MVVTDYYSSHCHSNVEVTPGLQYITSSPPGTSRRYGKRHQRCPALNHMCNQSKLMARHQVRVTSLPGCLKACDVQLVPAFCHSAKLSVCVSRMCSVSLLLSKIGNKKVCSNKERQRKTRSRHVEGIL